MSGSNALAAAKRRRGGVQDMKAPSPPGSRVQKPGQQQNQSQTPPSQVNPLQLVMLNHHRLNNIQNEIPKAIDSLGENFNSLSSNCDFLHEQITTLKNDVETLKSNDSNNQNKSLQPDTSIEKFNKLDNDISEIHKNISTGQSYSMYLTTQMDNIKDNTNNNMIVISKKIEDLENNIVIIINALNDLASNVSKLEKTKETVNLNNETPTEETNEDADDEQVDEEVNEEVSEETRVEETNE